jgi:phosphorylated CTD-interacting factor 1
MAKKGKKRRHNETTKATTPPQISTLHSSTTTKEDTIDSLLAEMMPQTVTTSSTTSSSSVSLKQEDKSSETNKNVIKFQELFESVDPELCDPSIPAWPLSSQLQERIRAWNRSMEFYERKGIVPVDAPSGFLPSIQVEITRHFKVQELSRFLLDACHEKLKMPAFERWLIDSKLERNPHSPPTASSFHEDDPVLSSAWSSSVPSQRLLEEICEAGIQRHLAKQIVRDLCRKTVTAMQEIAQQRKIWNHASSTHPFKKGDRIEIEDSNHNPKHGQSDDELDRNNDMLTIVYHRKTWNKPFCVRINKSHYEKLRAMFLRVHHDATFQIDRERPTKATHAFHLILMVLLLRYSSLSGGQLLMDLRGGGMQGAIHGQVFRVLREIFQPASSPFLECFGSPLNAFLPSFCSAFFHDMDWHFGSIGNFLETTITESLCEANPPFSPSMMGKMANRIEENLQAADAQESSLTFVVIVPNAGDTKDSNRAAAKRFGGVALQKLLDSPYMRLHVLLPAKEHGYVEGAQHMRPTRFKESLYDTSVIILQSAKAREQHHKIFDAKEQIESKIREAFASRHREEVAKRKRRDENGSDPESEDDSSRDLD